MLLGTEREWRVKNGQLKLQEVNHHGYVIDFLSSLKVSASFNHIMSITLVVVPYLTCNLIVRVSL